MDIYQTTIQSYKITSLFEGEERWGAKGVIFTPDGKLETEEFQGKSKEEVEKQATAAIKELLNKTSKK